MKLSKLRSLCDKAIEKYGDINVGTYSKDYAYDIEQEADLHGFKLRILANGGGFLVKDFAKMKNPMENQWIISPAFFTRIDP
jgi:hypothetical protein